MVKNVIKSVAGDDIHMVKLKLSFGIRKYRWNRPSVFSTVIYFIKKGHLKNVYWLTGEAFKGKDKYEVEICQFAEPLQNGKFVLDKVDYIKLYRSGETVILKKPLIEIIDLQNEQFTNSAHFPGI